MGENILRSILNLERSRQAGARLRRAPARRLDAVHLLEVAGGAAPRLQLEPGDGALALLAGGRGAGGVRSAGLVAGDGAEGGAGRVEREERRRGVGEEVVPRDAEVGRAQLLLPVGTRAQL